MKINNRLHISTVFSIIIVFVAGAILLLMFGQVNKVSEEGEKAGAVVRGIFELNILTNEYLLHHEKRTLTQWRSKHDSLSKLLSTLGFHGPEKHPTLSNINENLKNMKSLFSQLLSNYERRNFDRGNALHKQVEDRVISQLLVNSQEMVSDAFQFEKQNRKELLAIQKKINLIVMILFLTLSIIIALNSFLTGRSITKPIAKFQRDVDVIGTGNLDHRIDTKAKDEIGALARSFARMTENLKVLTASRDELNKEITERKRSEEELQQYRDHLEELVEEHTAELKKANIQLQQEIKERKRAEEQILWQSKVLETINKVFREALIRESDLEIAEICLSVAEELTGSKFGLIGEVNPAGRFDTIAISNPGWDTCKVPESEVAISIKDMEIRGIDRSTIRDETSRIVNDPASHPDRVGTPEGHPPITSFLGVPLKHTGKTIGMIGLGNKESGYNQADQEAIENLSIAFVEALMRKRAEMALATERERFRILVEESPLGVSIIGVSGDYTYVNPKFVEIFGYTLKDIPDGREWFRKAHPDPEYRTQVISKWLNDMKKAKVGEAYPYTWSVTCKDGSEKIIKFIAVLMKTGDQFVIYEDFTKQKKLEAQFRQSQKMEGIGRLAGGIAHDFNNLLTTIIGYTDITLMKIDKDSPLKSGIEEIKKASDRAANLTRQLLAFSRKQMIQPVVLNINHAVAEMDKMLRRLIGEDIDLITILEPELWKIKFDPGQVDQVVMNLAVNAKDAMPGGGKLTIETVNVDLDEAYARQHGIELKPGPFVLVAVSDTGMGIDEETQSHIFEPFFTTKEKGKGTGLGLSMVYGIVKQSGGFIWVYSEPGRGTTFKIYLPKVAAEEAFAEEEQMQPQHLEGSETILLAEDDDSARKLIRSVLQGYGYRILEAQDGEEALKLFEQHEGPIHLLLTDVVMPGMNGRELAERLHPLQPKMKVLYMSGYTDNAIVHHGVLESGMLFIQKPFTPEVLISKCRKVLDT